ncbi:hypothetical protein [Sphaerisporangium dianthi]|uniref:Uncharacterized protein n=1 Tax=Sphaerisporangium dianthi TaxID=1436120 RepID=A0ABV9CEK0_9ACTN
MASGVASVFKLLVATLAFCGAYFGVAAANGPAAPPADGGGHVRTVILSAQAMPVEVDRTPAPGLVTVGVTEAGGACRRVYHAQSVIAPGPADGAVVYRWSLRRWNPGTRAWKTYDSSKARGVPEERRTVEWHPRVAGASGWYRVELSVSGGRPIAGEKFKVTC